VRVSLQVMTTHPIEMGAWDLCSWWGAVLLIAPARTAFRRQLSAFARTWLLKA